MQIKFMPTCCKPYSIYKYSVLYHTGLQGQSVHPMPTQLSCIQNVLLTLKGNGRMQSILLILFWYLKYHYMFYAITL